jgi:hypothetical protein
MCEPMGIREIFFRFTLLVEIEGHFTNEFVSYVYQTEDRSQRQMVTSNGYKPITFYFIVSAFANLKPKIAFKVKRKRVWCMCHHGSTTAKATAQPQSSL